MNPTQRYFVRESSSDLGWVVKDSLNNYAIVPDSFQRERQLADELAAKLEAAHQKAIKKHFPLNSKLFNLF